MTVVEKLCIILFYVSYVDSSCNLPKTEPGQVWHRVIESENAHVDNTKENYYLIVNTASTALSAKNYCESLSNPSETSFSALAAIHYDAQMETIIDILNSTNMLEQDYWLSGVDNFPKCKGPQGWCWLQNSKLSIMYYEQWGDRYPDYSGDNIKEFTYMKNDYWANANGNELKKFICQHSCQPEVYFQSNSTWVQSCRNGEDSKIGMIEYLPNAYSMEFEFIFTNRAYGEVQVGRWYTKENDTENEQTIQNLVPYVHVHYEGGLNTYFSRNYPTFHFYTYYSSPEPFKFNQTYNVLVEISNNQMTTFLDNQKISSYSWENNSCYINDSCTGGSRACSCVTGGIYFEQELENLPVFVGQDFETMSESCFDFYVRDIKIFQ